eukprot:scaffold1330_cov240-Pinguiococcus_pyrenoidosus.AAC.9
MAGYFHSRSEFELPWDDRISFSCGFHWSAHTWLPVSMLFSMAPVDACQNLMHRSAVPPPLASKFRSCGDQASAFTAA